MTVRLTFAAPQPTKILLGGGWRSVNTHIRTLLGSILPSTVSCIAALILLAGCVETVPTGEDAQSAGESSPVSTGASNAAQDGSALGTGELALNPPDSGLLAKNSQSPPAQSPPVRPAQSDEAQNTPPESQPEVGSNPPLGQSNNPTPIDTNSPVNFRTASIQAVVSRVPQELLAHIDELDAAIQDLLVAGSSGILEKEAFQQEGLRLAKLKLDAAELLASLEKATADQRKAGKLAKLIALSHLSGLKDVQSAQRLEAYANELAKSEDPDLAHQSRVVRMGFLLQALQNGIEDNPNGLLAQAESLFLREQDRGYPELMMLQQAHYAMQQMGFSAAANRLKQIIVEEYLNSPNPQFRQTAWNLQTAESQELSNLVTAVNSLRSESGNKQAVVAAMRGLYEAFPSLATLERTAATMIDVEYAGHLSVSEQLADYLAGRLSDHAESSRVDELKQILSAHDKRFSLLGQSLELETLVSFSGKPFDWSEYEGKVLLVDFWATWCVPCLNEIPNIRETHERFSARGFDVISINMDESLERAQSFLAKQNFPWKSYHFSEADQLGFKSPLAKRLGIGAIPFMVLLAPDRTVAGIHVRGENLSSRIQALLDEQPTGSESASGEAGTGDQ